MKKRLTSKLELLHTLFRQSGQTLSLAESCTGGKLSDWITHPPGASVFFKGSVICYQTEVKENLLKVNPKIIKQEGVVSEKTALLMAQGVKALLKTDWSLSVTGFASPTGKNDEETGKTAFALCSPFAYQTSICYFNGNREDIKSKAALFALDLLLSELSATNHKEEI